MPSARAHINPKMLTWARQRLNADPARVARAAGTRLYIYQSWEKGTQRPTIKQLRKVARFLKRPVPHFYLNEPPEELEPRLSMRRVYGGSPRRDSFEFSRQVLECTRRREIALDLYSLLGDKPPELPDPFSVAQDPEQVGHQVRFDLLSVGVDAQREWRDTYEALRTWREALEVVGVLSFQLTTVDIAEARGFAIATRPLPVAAFNSTDSVRGRIFTLLHEFAHILLGSSTLHAGSVYSDFDETERWCNHVAAAVLIPRDDLLKRPQVEEHGQYGIWTQGEIEQLSRKYAVSPSALIRRLETFDRIAQSTFEALKEEFDTRRKSDDKEDQRGGNFYSNRMTQLGSLLPRLAFRSFYANEISAGDLSSIMGTKVGNLGMFEEKIMGSRYSFADA